MTRTQFVFLDLLGLVGNMGTYLIGTIFYSSLLLTSNSNSNPALAAVGSKDFMPFLSRKPNIP